MPQTPGAQTGADERFPAGHHGFHKRPFLVSDGFLPGQPPLLLNHGQEPVPQAGRSRNVFLHRHHPERNDSSNPLTVSIRLMALTPLRYLLFHKGLQSPATGRRNFSRGYFFVR